MPTYQRANVGEGQTTNANAWYYKWGDKYFAKTYDSESNSDYLKEISYNDIPEFHRTDYTAIAEASQPFWQQRVNDVFGSNAQYLRGYGKDPNGVLGGYGISNLGKGFQDIQFMEGSAPALVNDPNIGHGNLYMSQSELDTMRQQEATNVSERARLAGTTPQEEAARLQAQPGWMDAYNKRQADEASGFSGNQDITAQGVGILNEQDLQSKRQELTRAGVPQSDWSKYITPPDVSGKLYWRQPATLYGPNGKKQVVATGSQEANDLFKAGWSLTPQADDNIISSNSVSNESSINIGSSNSSNTLKADTVAGGFESTLSATQAEIDRLEKLLIGEAPDTENSKALDALLASLNPDSLTGRGAMQLSEEARLGIEEKRQALNAKTAELRRKSDEINALTASYNLANQTEEGRPQTLSRLQGSQAQNYKMYLAQKNSLTADAAFIQSDLLAMQDQLTSAQEAANRAVDLIYADREAKYNATLAKINILSPQVEKEEARYLNGLKLDLEDQQNKLAEEKAGKKQIQDFKLQAIGLRLSNNVVNQIGQAKTIEDAYRILVNNTPIKATGTPTATINQQSREAVQADMSTIRGSDGYVDTAKYAQIRQNVAVNEPDQLAWFDKTYPPQQVLNPNDQTALRYLQTPTQVVESTQVESNITDVLQQYKNNGYSKDDIEKLLTKKYGFVPAPAKGWLDKNFEKKGNWFTNLFK